MKSNDDNPVEKVLNWCTAVLGQFEVVSDHIQAHAGRRATAYRLYTPLGYCYVKSYREPAHWDSEVHGYEQWASAFGKFVPRLLAVRDEEPLALVVSELPGKILEKLPLSASQERAVWRAAGQALVALHDFAVGTYFGPCRRDGTCAGIPIYEAQEYVSTALDGWVERGLRTGCLSDDDLAIVRAARGLIPAFEGERPVPCHRDYCPANWLANSGGVWMGVIDFEFAYWDVRVADFTRYPDWNWLGRPDLVEAFFEGYGRSFRPEEEQQRLVAHTQYAVSAIVWGTESAYYGFVEEGRQALKRLGELLG
jgi:aminoglycoside phosphotransferase (APT) family kinase protein